MRSKIGMAACRNAGLVALAVGALTACGHAVKVDPNSVPANAPAPLNTLTASQAMAAIGKAGLPAVNPHDETAERCPELSCTQAVATDNVSLLKFPATGMAQKYAGSIANVYQVEDLVMVFAPSVTPDLKQAYENVVARAAV